MAVDWIDKNVYWADPVERVIKIGSLNDTSNFKTLIAENLEHPTAIAVSPTQRFEKMFDYFKKVQRKGSKYKK